MKRKNVRLVLNAVLLLAFSSGCSQGKKYHKHPYLAQSPWPIIHHSTAQEASTPFAGPGVDSEDQLDVTVIDDASGIGFQLMDSKKRVINMAIDPVNVRHVFTIYDARTLEKIDDITIPMNDLLSGIYSFIDTSDCIWTSSDSYIYRICLEDGNLNIKFQVDLRDYFPEELTEGGTIISIMPLYHSGGMLDIAFVTTGLKYMHQNDMFWREPVGTVVGVLRVFHDMEFEVYTKSFTGQGVTNSLAVDRDSAIYVLTTRAMKKLYLDETGGSPTLLEAWSYTYDPGPPMEKVSCPDTNPVNLCLTSVLLKDVRLSDGSGTTPTLMGQNLDYLGFADGVKPLRLIVLRTEDGSEVPIDYPEPFTDPEAQTENTIASFGDYFIIDNNNPQGRGVAGYHIESDGIKRIWVNYSVFAPTNIPLISGELMRLYIYEPKSDGWYITSMNLLTGEVIWSKKTGNGLGYDIHYGPLTLDDEGNIYAGLMNHLIVLRKK